MVYLRHRPQFKLDAYSVECQSPNSGDVGRLSSEGTVTLNKCELLLVIRGSPLQNMTVIHTFREGRRSL